MSKQRPSDAAPATPLERTRSWSQRVFKNSYTRGGQLKTVHGWSVKIQHQGHRHTFALRARLRSAAASEAQAIHQTILTEGWETALRRHSPHARRRAEPASTARDLPSRTEAGYWKLRLLRCKYPDPSGTSASDQLAARIEHDGTSHCFPLGTANEDAAAAKASEIYQTVRAAGWEEAGGRFPRELTLAFHWAANPLAWTYATLHTRPATSAPPVASGAPPAGGPALAVAIVESERGLHHALAWHLRTHVSAVRAFGTGEEALREIPRQRMHLVLVNHTLADMGAAPFAEGLRRLTPRLPVLIYSVHEDSQELFKATPGGVSGYILKRTPPGQLLAPMEGLLTAAPISSEQISEHVRQYFNGITSALQTNQHGHELGRLTAREREVLEYLCKGYLDKGIAGAMGISTWTVHGHIKHIFEKLGVHSRTEAAVKYLHK